MSDVQFNFNAKTALITGGASGIGEKISTSFLNAGAQVVVWDYSQDAINAFMAKNERLKDNIIFQKVDVSNRENLAASVSQLKVKIDILVNNAGITRDKSFAKLGYEDWDAVINTNLTGLFNVTKSLAEVFSPEQKNKRIINISSVVGIYGNFGQTNYAAAKAGVIGMTKTLGKELGRKGFTVNAIAPGFIRTAMTSAMPAEVLQQMSKKVPVERLGEVDDIANAVLFLASNAASYVNGTVLSVDGGIVL